MIKKTKKLRKVEVIEDVICNRCAKSLKIKNSSSPNDFFGLVEHTIHGSYDSISLNDCTSYTFSLCEKCLAGLFKSFEIPPKIDKY